MYFRWMVFAGKTGDLCGYVSMFLRVFAQASPVSGVTTIPSLPLRAASHFSGLCLNIKSLQPSSGEGPSCSPSLGCSAQLYLFIICVTLGATFVSPGVSSITGAVSLMPGSRWNQVFECVECKSYDISFATAYEIGLV